MKKEQKNRLIKVCKVLFPKYKHVKVDTIGQKVILRRTYIPILSMFKPKWVVSISEMINYQIPKQLADFKYGNETFINVIQEDLVRCELLKESKIDYFLEEINKIKFADVYKQFDLPAESRRILVVEPEEDEYDAIIRHYEKEKRSITLPTVSNETLFYIALLVIVAVALLT